MLTSLTHGACGLGARARPAAPLRRSCRLLPARPLPRSRLAVAAAAASDDASTEFARMVASGGPPRKTAVAKLPVAELRAECVRLGLAADGLKADLVERLLGWWAEAHLQQQQGGQAQPAQQPAHQQQQQAAEPAPVPRAASAPSSATPPPQPAPAPERGTAPVPAERIAVTWLGTSSGNPTPRRNVSCIAVQYDDDVYLVDAGEGSRNQMRKSAMDVGRVRRIFVTHMHGDHCFGTGSLLAAICEARLGTPLQHEPVYVYGPPEMQQLVAFAIRSGAVQLTTPVVVTGWVLDPRRARAPAPVDVGQPGQAPLAFALQGPDQGERMPPEAAARLQAAYDSGSENIVQNGLTWSVRVPGGPQVAAAQLQHRVPCWGYVFQEPQTPADPPAAAAAATNGAGQQEQPAAEQQQQQQQQQWVRRGRKLVILGDTCDSSAIAPLALGCDLLSHEATFSIGMEDKAAIAQHSTTEMAGSFAAAVAARTLVLTHFSARYESISASAAHLKRERRASSGAPEPTRGEAIAEVLSTEQLKGEMQRLRHETARAFGRKDGIHLAHDFYCFTVEPPEPLPADVLQAQQAQLAEQAQQMLLAPQAPRAAAPRGGPRTYQAPRGPPRDRPGGGGGGYGQRPQQRWQQRDGSGGGYQRQQRGGQGGGYQRQQRDGQAGGYQRQQRQPGGSGGWQARDPEEARP